MTQAYTTRTGAKQFKPSQEWITEVIDGDNSAGFCLACGHEQDGCEPDMRRGQCEQCGQDKVYGAEELALMGLCHS